MDVNVTKVGSYPVLYASRGRWEMYEIIFIIADIGSSNVHVHTKNVRNLGVSKFSPYDLTVSLALEK